MGITGLIPFLEKASSPINVSQYSGRTVAIDAYCWLHKGAFACADKLARGDNCDTYVFYCMKFVNMLLSLNIKPILVFDGQKLPAKGDTEKKRKENRETNRKKAAELMRLDRGREAQIYLRRCVDITHEMALNLIKACRSRNVDCIVAPYEADAQLAFFNINNIADLIITEDSDLLLFGAKKVLFKMDLHGNGLLINQEKLHLAMGVRPENFSFDKFRYMCILSGCDYLPSLPGIGLVKACRFVVRTADPDIHRAISRISSHLNMPQLIVTKEYRDNFMMADFMFRYQPVFDPFQRCIIPLNPISDDICTEKFNELLAITNLSTEQTQQLAYGNLEPFTLNKMDDWEPGQVIVSKHSISKGWNNSAVASHPSIWSPNFEPNSWNKPKPKVEPPNALSCGTTAGVKILQDTSSLNLTSTKRIRENLDSIQDPEVLKNAVANLKDMYSETKEELVQNKKKLKSDVTSPKKTHHNPFFKTGTKTSVQQSHQNISALSKIASICKTTESTSNKVVSRYFFSSSVDKSKNPYNADNADDSDKSEATVLQSTYSVKESPVKANERSPLKDQNNGFSYQNKTQQKNENCSAIKKKLNPFAVKDSLKNYKVIYPVENCSQPRMPKSSSFRWSGKTDAFINQTVERNSDVSSEIKAFAAGDNENDENKKCSEMSAEQENEDEGFCSPSLEINKSPIFEKTKCRSVGLHKKNIAKQKTLLAMFGRKEPPKLKL